MNQPLPATAEAAPYIVPESAAAVEFNAPSEPESAAHFEIGEPAIPISDEATIATVRGILDANRADLYLQPIVYPAVAKHRSRFRISVSAAHTHDQLNEGVAILAHVLREEGIL